MSGGALRTEDPPLPRPEGERPPASWPEGWRPPVARWVTGRAIPFAMAVAAVVLWASVAWAGFEVDFLTPLIALGGWLGGRELRRWALLRVLTKRLHHDEDDLPVQVAVRDEHGNVYGVDPGYLSVVEGWLHFRGLRTGWSVSRSEAVPTRDGFVVPRPFGDIHIGLSTLSAEPFAVSEHPRDRLLREWKASPVPTGLAILPPKGGPRRFPWGPRGFETLMLGWSTFCAMVAILLILEGSVARHETRASASFVIILGVAPAIWAGLRVWARYRLYCAAAQR